MFKAIQNFAKAQPVIFTVVLLLIVGLIIYFIGRKSGKESIPALPGPVQNPNQTPQPGVDLTFQPGPLTDKLAKEIIGFTWIPRDEKPFQQLLTLPDWQFRAVAEDWQKRYFVEADNMTLIQAIINESTAWDSFRTLQDSIARRAQELGIV